jgi:hypothetical protein
MSDLKIMRFSHSKESDAIEKLLAQEIEPIKKSGAGSEFVLGIPGITGCPNPTVVSSPLSGIMSNKSTHRIE